MRRTVGARTRLWLGALAATGVAVTHLLAYRITVPDPHAREQLLTETGHAYWPFVVALALGGLVAGLAGLSGERWGGVRPERPARLFWGVAPRLMLLQGLGFLLLEGLERIVVVGDLHGFLGEPVLIVGLAVQLLVALAAALFLVLFVRAVDRLVALMRRTWPRARAAVPAPPLVLAMPRLRPASGGPTLRAPPLPALI